VLSAYEAPNLNRFVSSGKPKSTNGGANLLASLFQTAVDPSALPRQNSPLAFGPIRQSAPPGIGTFPSRGYFAFEPGLITKLKIKKIAVGFLGGFVLLAGIAMIALPGPAVLVIPAGLAILATEFEWAHRLKTRFQDKFQLWRERHERRKQTRAAARRAASASPAQRPLVQPRRGE
jgi:hypothetical protein